MISFNLKLALLGLLSCSATVTVGGCASSSSSRSRDDEREVTVTLAELPAAVRATLEREAAGGSIEEIERETGNDGLVVYSADTKIAGKVYDIEIAADGTLIGRDLD